MKEFLSYIFFAVLSVYQATALANDPPINVHEFLEGISSGRELSVATSHWNTFFVNDLVIAEFLKAEYGLVNVTEKMQESTPGCEGGYSTHFQLLIQSLIEQRLIEEKLPLPQINNGNVRTGYFKAEMTGYFEKLCDPKLVKSFNLFLVDLRIALNQGIKNLPNSVKVERDQKLAKEQKSREEEKMVFMKAAAIASNSRIAGYRDFKFGMSANNVQNLQGKGCASFMRVYENFTSPRLLGQNCYEIGGKRRPIVFRFASEKSYATENPGPLVDISILLDDYTRSDENQVIKYLSNNYGAAVFSSTNEIRDLFDRNIIQKFVLAAFKDWSVVYMAERKNKGGISTKIRLNSDKEALLLKESHLNSYKELTRGNFKAH